jgi:small subunit ribosomal protein S3
MNYGVEHNEDAGQLVKKPRRNRQGASQDKNEGSEPAKKARS